MIRWIFWDLGDVIFNEDYLRYAMYERLYRFLRKQNPKFEFTDVIEIRKKVILQEHSESPILTIAREYLPSMEFNKFNEELMFFYKKYHGKYIKIIPKITTLLNTLSKRYKLGIIANQPAFIMHYLKSQKLTGYFKAIYLSGMIGIKKPDVRIFEKALRENKINASEMIYIGNRLEHDILPASRLGIRSILAYFSPQVRGFVPSTFYERVFSDAIAEIPEWPQNLNIAKKYALVITTPAELETISWEDIPYFTQVENEKKELKDLSLGELIKKILLGDLGD